MLVVYGDGFPLSLHYHTLSRAWIGSIKGTRCRRLRRSWRTVTGFLFTTSCCCIWQNRWRASAARFGVEPWSKTNLIHLSVRLECAMSVKEYRQGVHLRVLTVESVNPYHCVCDAWPVRRHTSGYPTSLRWCSLRLARRSVQAELTWVADYTHQDAGPKIVCF